MKLLGPLVVAAALFTAGTARADVVQCKGLFLKSVTIEGTRDDNHEFNKKLIITFNGECGGRSYAHLELGDPALHGMLSIALAAKAANKPVSIALNKSNATSLSYQLAYIELE